MQTRNLKILGTGKYLPPKITTSEALDQKLNLPIGWTERKTGILKRHHIENETSSQMGAQAAIEAIKNSNLSKTDIDCIVCASGTAQQEIPCTASLIQKELGLEWSGIPCFDINSTCLSFITALDTMSYLLEAERHKNILIVSSEISSVALNWDDKESCTLFGDGAAAVVITKTPENESSKLLCSNMKTYSKGAGYTEIRCGGTMVSSRDYSEEKKLDYLFYMNGKKIYKLASQILPDFIEKLLSSNNLKISDMDLVIPHQASKMAMALTQKKLNIQDGKFMYIIENHGNTIASSIPMALHEAIKQNKIQRRDKIMLLGTSAGFSVGAIALEY